MLIESQESCIVNAGTKMPYFNLEKGAGQGDPVSAYLFILCLEVLFLIVKANHIILGVNIFQWKTFSQLCCLKPDYENVKLKEWES